MIKLAAIVILYHPEESVFRNVSSYAEHVDRIYIYDNTQTSSAASLFNHLSKAVFIHDGLNRGISERLNDGCQQATSEGYEWILTMDQDTYFSPDAINFYITCFSQFPEKESIAMFSTINSRFAKPSYAACSAKEVLYTITSGVLLNLNIWKRLNGFDEALFIDAVDYDYSLSARLNGFRIICFENIHIVHCMGTEVHRASIKTLYLIRRKKIVHSALRCYYMYRNMLYMEKKYRQSSPDFARAIRKVAEGHIKTCILYNGQSRATRKYVKIAKEDFENNRMGKIADDKLIK